MTSFVTSQAAVGFKQGKCSENQWVTGSVCLVLCENVSYLSPCLSFWLTDCWSVSRVFGELEISGSSDLAAPVVDPQCQG